MTTDSTFGGPHDVLRVATYNIHKGVQGVGPARRLEIHNLALAIETLAGKPEVSMFYERPDGLWLRGQMDIMGADCTDDYKTTADASSFGFSRMAWLNSSISAW